MTRAEAVATLTAPGQPGELEDIVVRGRRLRAFKNAPPSLRAYYEAYVTDLPFLAYEDERFTFAQAWQQASRIGRVLVHDCGLRPGDRVAISMRNYPEWMLASRHHVRRWCGGGDECALASRRNGVRPDRLRRESAGRRPGAG